MENDKVNLFTKHENVGLGRREMNQKLLKDFGQMDDVFRFVLKGSLGLCVINTLVI